jgi:PAS domain-containing protein
MAVSTAVHPEHGEVWVGVFEDITKRKRAEEAARKERVFRNAVEDAFLAGITVVDQNGRQSYVNRAF